MHDAMFANQHSLAVPALGTTAQRAGLDVKSFKACQNDPAAEAAVKADIRAGEELNVTSTPAFMINGRPLSGSLPAAQFESVIDDELRRARQGGRTIVTAAQ